MKKGNHIALIIVIITLLIIIGIIGITAYKLNNKKEEIIVEQEKQHRTGKVYDKDIKSITIKYYNGYNIATGDAIKESIPAFKIELQKEELEKATSFIKTLEYFHIEKDCGKKENCIDIIEDNYELIINNKFSLYLDKEYGFVEDPYDTFKVPEELYNLVVKQVEKNNKENVYKQLNSKKLTIISNGEKLEVKDPKYIEEISNYNYYKTNIKDNDEVYEEDKLTYTLDLNDGRKIDLYFISPLSRLYNKDGSHINIYSGDLYELIDKIYNNSKVKMNTSPVNVIRVTFKGKEYKITDKTKINEIINELKYLEYSDCDYAKESDYGDEDILIYINKTKYIIPGEEFIGNRLYVDEAGKLYSVSNLTNTKTEKYVKELVNYKD